MTELRVHELLQAVYEGGEIAPFDYAAEKWPGDEGLTDAKAAADMLTSLRLAKYTDEGRTRLTLSNAGRYWALHGGFLAFLKEEPEKAGGGRNRSPEVEALRATYMALRLKTFWWSFGMSAVGFIVSIISLSVALTYGERLLPR